MSSPSAAVLCEGSLPPSSSPSLAAPHLELILGQLLPTYADLPPASLSALSRTSNTLRTHLFSRVFCDLVVRRTLVEHEGEEAEDERRRPSSSDEARRAVRKLDWTLAAEENCVDDDEDDGDFERSQDRMRSKVARTAGEINRLGELLSSLPSLTHLSLTSQTYSPLPLLTLPSRLLPQLSNLCSLILTGFIIPDPTLLALLVATPHLVSLTLQTFAPPPTTSASLSASSDPTPVPSAIPPNLPHSALRHLQEFTGLASHVGPLLRGGQTSLRRLEVEMCGFEGGWEELVRKLDDLPVRAGSAGLRELKVTGVELMGVDDGVEMIRKLGSVLSGKGALEVLELGALSGLGEQKDEVERFLTLALPHFPALASLRSLTLTTPELTPSTTTAPSSHHLTTSPAPTTPLPLLPLSKILPRLATLTLNATLWRFLRPDVVSTSPTHARSSALYNPLHVPAALNGNKKLRKRTTSFLRECASGSRHAGVSSSSDEE